MNRFHARTLLASTCCLTLALATGPPSAAADGWPGLRGPGYDGAVRDATLFAGEIGELAVTWKRDLGPGYPVVVADGERLVAAFQSGQSDVVAAFDHATGDELWRQTIGQAHAGHTGSHDGPIATPALAGGRVFALGPRGHLLALDAAQGSPLWSKHLADDLGSEAPFYGFASSPLAGTGTMVAPPMAFSSPPCSWLQTAPTRAKVSGA